MTRIVIKFDVLFMKNDFTKDIQNFLIYINNIETFYIKKENNFLFY